MLIHKYIYVNIKDFYKHITGHTAMYMFDSR